MIHNIILELYIYKINYNAARQQYQCLKIALINMILYIDGLAQDCSNSIANALELLQSCTKPSIS